MEDPNELISILEACLEEEKEFEDDTFLPNEKSLWHDVEDHPEKANNYSKMQWKRPTEYESDEGAILFDPDLSITVKWGNLRDDWFLDAIATITPHVDMISSIFESFDDFAEIGGYVLKFFDRQCSPFYVLIDDWVPCYVKSGPVYSKSQSNDEMWLPLLEKAVAKYCGGYDKLIDGDVCSFLTLLTGFYYQKEYLDSRKNESPPDDLTLWEHFFNALKDGMPVGCVSEKPSDVVEYESSYVSSYKHILQKRAYSVVSVFERDGHHLVQLYDPWLKVKYPTNIFNTENDEGIVIMEISEFTDIFTTIWYGVNVFDSDKYEAQVFDGSFSPGFDGGCVNHRTCFENPQYLLDIQSEDDVLIWMTNSTTKEVDLAHCGKFEPMGLYIFEADQGERKISDGTHSDIFAKSQFEKSPIVSLTAKLSPNVDSTEATRLVLLPCTFDPKVHFDYTLVVAVKKGVNLEVTEFGDWENQVIQDEWIGESAGGSGKQITWVNNPQYNLIVKKKQKVSISLTTVDPEAEVVKGARRQKRPYIASYLASKNHKKRLLSPPASNALVHPVTFSNGKVNHFEAELNVGTYGFVPCTLEKDVESPFWVTIEHPLCNSILFEKITHEMDWKVKVIEGQWKGDTAAGCISKEEWFLNPCYLIEGKPETEVIFRLEQDADTTALGMYTFKQQQKKYDGALHQKQMLVKGQFIHGNNVDLEISIPRYGRFFLYPCLFDANIEGSFKLTIYSSNELDTCLNVTLPRAEIEVDEPEVESVDDSVEKTVVTRRVTRRHTGKRKYGNASTGKQLEMQQKTNEELLAQIAERELAEKELKRKEEEEAKKRKEEERLKQEELDRIEQEKQKRLIKQRLINEQKAESYRQMKLNEYNQAKTILIENTPVVSELPTKESSSSNDSQNSDSAVDLEASNRHRERFIRTLTSKYRIPENQLNIPFAPEYLPTINETFLSDQQFETVLKMTKEKWDKLSKGRKLGKKQSADIF
eukprot:TRINITY_DN4560_c0_g1_i1.p1 TRINITY_DN4560_c0_g1~~TRINITY_DN4560_c0_g1_i1.p1  ORF type:complete len:984 (+),score=300.81 TRINITY_DN4560_c0_g1_i1:53-3004(+)